MGSGQNGDKPYMQTPIEKERETAPGYRPSLPKKISPNGLELIQHFESLFLKAYPDPGTKDDPIKKGEPWTIGWGTVRYPNGGKVNPGDTCTKEQADIWLLLELEEKSKEVNEMVKVEMTQNEFDALLSFAYNCGTNALRKSTLLSEFNIGDAAGAAEEFLKWNKANGKVLPGLTRRRNAERNLFLGGDWREWKK